MFASDERAGWHDRRGQILIALLAVLPIIAILYMTGNIVLAAVVAFLPIALFFVLDCVYAAALLFIAFSYFRIHEAYPFLVPLKIPLLLGAVVLVGTIYRALVVDVRIMQRAQLLRPIAVAMAVSTIGLALLFFLPAFSNIEDRTSQVLCIVVMGATIATMIVWVRMLSRSSDVPWPKEAKLFVAFFCLVTVGAAFSVDVSNSFFSWQVLYWKVGAICIALIWLTQEPRDFASVFMVVLISGILVSVVAIYNSLNGIDLVEGTRVTIGRDLYSGLTKEQADAQGIEFQSKGSLLGDPNELALVLLLPLSFATACIVQRGSKTLTVLSLIAFPLLILAILATQSRGAIIGVLALFGVIGARYIKSKLVLACAGLVGLVGLLLVMDISGRVSGGLAEVQSSGIDESASGRITAWKAAIRMAIANPLSGIGMDNFLGQYFTYTDLWLGKAKGVHSTWFQVLSETGFPGFALFITMILTTWRSIRNSLNELSSRNVDPILKTMALALLGGFAGFCAAGTFLTQAFGWAINVIIALAAALAICLAKQKRDASISGGSA